MVWKRLNRGSEIDKDLDLSNPTVSLVLRVLENHLGELAESVFLDTCKASGIPASKITGKTISKFTKSLQEQTSDLLGSLGAKYLCTNLEKALV